MANNNLFEVRGEWLVDNDGKIVYKPLSFWLDYFGVKPVDGHPYIFKTNEDRVFIDIELHGGYSMNWNDKDKYMNELFFVGNADLCRMKIRQKSE